MTETTGRQTDKIIGHKDSRVWIGACALAEERHALNRYPQPQDIKDAEIVFSALDGATSPTNFMPQEGAVYKHYKGGLYQVLMVVRREGDKEQMVVYQPSDGTIPWVRPLTEFAEKFSYVSNTGWER